MTQASASWQEHQNSNTLAISSITVGKTVQSSESWPARVLNPRLTSICQPIRKQNLINYSINGTPIPPEISSNHLISHIVWGQRWCATCKKHEPPEIKRFDGKACHIRFSVCRARLNVTRFNRSDSHLRITPNRKPHSSVMPWLYGAFNITTGKRQFLTWANLLLCEMKWAINAFNFPHFSGWKLHNKSLLWGPTSMKKAVFVFFIVTFNKESITITLYLWFDFEIEI